MTKGGRREGAGRKATWRSGPTKAVKLPVALCSRVIAYAHRLDAGEVAPPDERYEDQLERIHQLEFRLEMAQRDLRAAQDDVKRAHEQRLREWGRANEAASGLIQALASHDGHRNVPRPQVEKALDKLVPGWRT